MDSILKCYIDIPFDCGSVHIRLIGVRIHVISIIISLIFSFLPDQIILFHGDFNHLLQSLCLEKHEPNDVSNKQCYVLSLRQGKSQYSNSVMEREYLKNILIILSI